MLSLNPRPQRREMRNRLLPSSGAGYDFHRQFRLLAHRHLSGGENLEALIAETRDWGNPHEGRSARAALRLLSRWREDYGGDLHAFEPRGWSSPNDLFRVRYTPDFGVSIDGVRVAVHVWKTQHPPLDARMTYVALALFPDLYGDHARPPQDFAVLSLIDGRLYRLSDVGDQDALTATVVAQIERTIRDLSDEIGRRSPEAPADQPAVF